MASLIGLRRLLYTYFRNGQVLMSRNEEIQTFFQHFPILTSKEAHAWVAFYLLRSLYLAVLRGLFHSHLSGV